MKLTNFLFRLRWFIGGLAIILATFAVLGGIGYAKYLQIQTAIATPPPPESPTSVGLATATEVRFRRSTVVVGTVLAPRSVRLRTELSGMVTSVKMEVGKSVKQGEVLVQFDARTENAELKSAKASLRLAQSELDRAKKMTISKSISVQEREVAEANVSKMEAEVDRLSVLIDRKTIRAPFDAKVGLFQLHTGQYLDAGTEITTLEGFADYVDLDFSVPQHIAESLKTGDCVSMKSGSHLIGPAQIVALDSKADPVSRTLKARAHVKNPPDTLRPNDSVRVVVEFGPEVTAVAVPTTAIRRGPSGTTLFLAVEEKGALRARSTKIDVIGTGTGSTTWIGPGVAPGETVVAEGSFKLRDGGLLVAALQNGEVLARSAENEPKEASNQ